MDTIRALSKDDLDELYDRFSKGRPMRVDSPAGIGGFSLLAGLMNSLGKLQCVEKVPAWVRDDMTEAEKQLQRSASLLPYVSVRMMGSGIIYEAVDHGTPCAIRENDGNLRLSILLGKYPEAWMVSCWDAESKKRQPLPNIGNPVKMPIDYDPVRAKDKMARAYQIARAECSRRNGPSIDNRLIIIAFAVGPVVWIINSIFKWFTQ